MEKIDIVKATEYTSPNPVTVICTTKPDGTPNLAPVSWFTYLSLNPPTVAFAMDTGPTPGRCSAIVARRSSPCPPPGSRSK